MDNLNGKRFAWGVHEPDGAIRGIYYTRTEKVEEIKSKLVFTHDKMVRLPKFDLEDGDVEEPTQ